MDKLLKCTIVFMVILLVGCQTTGKQQKTNIITQSASTNGRIISQKDIKWIVGSGMDLYVTFDISNNEITIVDISQTTMHIDFDKMYSMNTEKMKNASGDNNTVSLRDCVRISDGIEYSTCTGNRIQNGSIFKKTKIAGNSFFGSMLGKVLGNQFYKNSELVNLVGKKIAYILHDKFVQAATTGDSLCSFLKKYPKAKLYLRGYFVENLAKHAKIDYSHLRKRNGKAVRTFINKYTNMGSITCYSPKISTLNFRRGPGTKYRKVGVMKSTDRFCRIYNAKNNWVQFSGNEINKKYHGFYWVSKKHIKKSAKRVQMIQTPEFKRIIGKAKLDLKTIEQTEKKNLKAAKQAEKKKRLAAKEKELKRLNAEAEKKRKEQERKDAETKKQKTAKLKLQLDTAIAEKSINKLGAFIKEHKSDPDASELISIASDKYKELLLAD